MAYVIDVWTAHPTPRFARHEMFESLRRRTGTCWPTEELPLEQTIAAIDAVGVTRGLIRAWCGSEGPLISNDEVAGFVARRPVCAIRELRALRIVLWLWGLPPNDRRCCQLYAARVELGIPSCTQVGHTPQQAPASLDRPDLDSKAAELLLSADVTRVFGL